MNGINLEYTDNNLIKIFDNYFLKMNMGASCVTDKLLPKKEVPAKLIKVAQIFIFKPI